MSPVIMITSKPRPLSCSTDALESGFTASAIAITPPRLPSTAISTGVFASLVSFLICSIYLLTSIFKSFIRSILPITILLLATFARTPLPVNASKSFISSNSIFFNFALSTIACAKGCSDLFSTEAAKRNNSCSSVPLLVIISVTTGLPIVKVPVLSMMMLLSLLASSSDDPLFISIPDSAPLPVPTIIAVGVASPNAQGQAIIKTAIKVTSAKVNACSPPKIIHKTKVRTAIASTAGTK